MQCYIYLQNKQRHRELPRVETVLLNILTNNYIPLTQSTMETPQQCVKYIQSL